MRIGLRCDGDPRMLQIVEVDTGRPVGGVAKAVLTLLPTSATLELTILHPRLDLDVTAEVAARSTDEVIRGVITGRAALVPTPATEE